MKKSFLEKVRVSPNVPKYAVKALAQSIVTAANRTIYSVDEILNVRNYIQDRGYRMDILTIAENIGGAAVKCGLSFKGMVMMVCLKLDLPDGVQDLRGSDLRAAVLKVIAEIEAV